MSRSRRSGVVALSGLTVAGLLISSFGSLSPAQGANRFVDTLPSPVINSVEAGETDTQLVVNYRTIPSMSIDPANPSTSAKNVKYEVSLDTKTWWPCPTPTSTDPVAVVGVTAQKCPLVNLKPQHTYPIYLRAFAVGGSAPATSAARIAESSVVGPAIGTTMIPSALDPAKPKKLPKPRKWVGAKFIAASNSLGVDGSQVRVGVGVLPKLVFGTNIPDKAVVEERLVVSAQLPNGKIKNVVGAWGWVSDRSAVFRPKNYWPGNSTIRIVANLGRAELGMAGKTHLIASKKLDTTYSFETARKFVARVDGATRKMKVFIDGKKEKTFLVSLGKKDWETRNGTKVISTSKEANKIYRSESLGLTDPDDQYELEAPWNTRLTPTGEFIHSAPWAYGRLGRYNGSHGCTNMFEKDAKWIYDQTIPGDVIFYTNTGGTVPEPWNGPGGLWNIPWNKWLKKSALQSGNDSVETDTNAGTGSLQDAKPASA